MRRWFFATALVAPIASVALWACGSDQQTGTTTASSSSSSSGVGGHGGAGGGSGGASTGGGDAGMDAGPSVCDTLGLPVRDFAQGPYGTHRGDVADDLTVPLVDGSMWNLKANWSGCENYVFVPDNQPVSETDPTSVWESDKDLAALVKASPKNTQYFFVSKKSAAAADTATKAMQARIDALLKKLKAPDDAHWRDRLHVVATRAADLGGWLTTIFSKNGGLGFSIDRAQRIRGIGYFSDVARYDAALNQAGKWPFKSNLAYAANEPAYLNAQNDLQAKIDADGATVVELFKGETLQEFAETDVMLPSAQEMAKFDTLTIEVTQMCPDPDKVEIGNCGAWDYIASLGIGEGDNGDGGPAVNTEIARFITSYHRETHWLVDATPFLAKMKDGGSRHFRWDFAPSWNVQPTGTKLALRFSNQKKGYAPKSITPLYTGGDFGSAYNTPHMPIDVPISATAKRVELFAIITGHGSGTSQCSEFCNHQHEFTVAGHMHKKDYPMAGTNAGCVPELANGMTPNQAGTWWFGRGGWCPGRQVDPFVVDVTGEVTLGANATVSYRGLFNGNDPPDGAGNIDLVSYIVVYE
jgi:hypothetical protein